MQHGVTSPTQRHARPRDTRDRHDWQQVSSATRHPVAVPAKTPISWSGLPMWSMPPCGPYRTHDPEQILRSSTDQVGHSLCSHWGIHACCVNIFTGEHHTRTSHDGYAGCRCRLGRFVHALRRRPWRSDSDLHRTEGDREISEGGWGGRSIVWVVVLDDGEARRVAGLVAVFEPPH